jgi:polyhydroxybutyrate depolymerase
MLFLLAVGACGSQPERVANQSAAIDETETRDREIEVVSGGRARSALVHVPATYSATKPAMLVLSFHGVTMSAEEEATLTGMNAVSDEHGFVVAYPRGVGKSWNAGPVCCGQAVEEVVDDVQFVRDLLAALEEKLAVDKNRIFATGFSNGGFFSHRVGCELADRIAAIAPVAGVMGIERNDCHPARPISVLDFHGTDDWVVPYNGSLLGSFIPAPDAVAAWRAADGCGATEQGFASGDTTCERAACAAGTEVSFCTVRGGGHAWPGSHLDDPSNLGRATQDVDASRMIYDFFVANPMRPTTPVR